MTLDQYSVPLAGPADEVDQPQPDPGMGPPAGPLPFPTSTPPPFPFPFPPQRLCSVKLPDGCYRLSYTPNGGSGVFRGTVRVDRGAGSLTVSGDLYFFPLGADQPDVPAAPADPSAPPIPSVPIPLLGIPIHPRSRYHSYLKATHVTLKSIILPGMPCRGSITLEQYDYTHPPTGSFNGAFPPAPGSRNVTLRFSQKPPPLFIWPGNYYEGEWVEGGVVTGTITLGWVSPSFRRCTVEVDTLVGAVAPEAVPAPGGGGDESFATMLASAGWSADVAYDQVGVPVPAGVADPTDCWTDGALHGLMTTVRRATTDLDSEWRMHLVVVPGQITCSRGKMYDSIGVPREGVVSYSDDGYPASHSSFFGAAEGKMQRQVPRAFLRSASHEVVHGFNQIHQETEGGADNSIMTTTPSVANVLGTATSGGPGIFPDDIKLTVNERVRHHLVHFPDPVVRPGGHTFFSWVGTPVPSADVNVPPDYLDLAVTAQHTQIELGEPLALSWTVTNRSDAPIAVPNPVTIESLNTTIAVVDADGRPRLAPTFVIECDSSRIENLAPGESRSAGTRLYWSTNGFAFERPGRYTVEVRLRWAAGGIHVTVTGELHVFVNYPVSAADNAAAATLLHPDVGTWVVLGGGAPHLTEAVQRLHSVVEASGMSAREVDGGETGQVKALRGYSGLLP